MNRERTMQEGRNRPGSRHQYRTHHILDLNDLLAINCDLEGVSLTGAAGVFLVTLAAGAAGLRGEGGH